LCQLGIQQFAHLVKGIMVSLDRTKNPDQENDDKNPKGKTTSNGWVHREYNYQKGI
jgi:hypothetical protein